MFVNANSFAHFCSFFTDLGLCVQVRRSYSTRAELFCHLSKHPSYIWYKNGQKIEEETSSSYPDYFDPADSYSYAVKKYEDFPAHSVCEFTQ